MGRKHPAVSVYGEAPRWRRILHFALLGAALAFITAVISSPMWEKRDRHLAVPTQHSPSTFDEAPA
jgi:hypothetical protein